DEYLVAKAFALPRYQWFSIQYIERLEDPGDDRIEVRRDGGTHQPRSAKEKANSERQEEKEWLAALADIDGVLRAREKGSAKGGTVTRKAKRPRTLRNARGPKRS